jgi:hypothetical protein
MNYQNYTVSRSTPRQPTREETEPPHIRAINRRHFARTMLIFIAACLFGLAASLALVASTPLPDAVLWLLPAGFAGLAVISVVFLMVGWCIY